MARGFQWCRRLLRTVLVGKTRAPFAPPVVELRSVGEYRTQFFVGVASNRQRFFLFPTLDGRDAPPQVRSNFLPGVDTIRSRPLAARAFRRLRSHVILARSI